MFLRRMLGREKAPEPPPPERLPIEALEMRMEEMKLEKLRSAKIKLDSLFKNLCEERDALLRGLKKLSEAEPTEEVHPGLHKAASEARRLLIEKLTRAVSGIHQLEDLSVNGLLSFDGKLTKMVNLTTDAIITHGRYVRATFGLHLTSIETRLQRLHEFAKEIHTTIEGVLGEMRSLDSISSKISSCKGLLHRVAEMRANVSSLENQARLLEELIENESKKLAQLVSSKEFEDLKASICEIERIELEIARVKDEASDLISGLSRPFRKMEKLLAAGEFQMDPDTVKVLELCIESPSELLSSNEKIASLDRLLGMVIELLESGKVRMEERERRKRIELARELLEGKKLQRLREQLTQLHARTENRKRALGEASLLKQKAELEGSIEKHKADSERARASIEEINHELRQAEMDLDKNLREIEKLAAENLGMRVELIS